MAHLPLFQRSAEFAPFISAPTTFVACIFILAGSVIWAALIKRAGDVNSWTVQPTQVPLSVKVSTGNGLNYTWAAFAFLAASLLPHMFMSVQFCLLTLTTPER